MKYNESLQPLVHGSFYHIFNRGNSKENIFKEARNYEYFLTLWSKYIDPIAETLCYNLLPNHFHFFVYIKTKDELLAQHEKSAKKSEPFVLPVLEKQFSNMFNAYAKAINKVHKRTGSLFQKRFRRKEVFDEIYFQTAVAYIITNAVKHGLCTSASEYPYSSFAELKLMNENDAALKKIVKWFGDKEKFLNYIKSYELQILASKYLILEDVQAPGG